MDRGAWQATVHRAAQSWTQPRTAQPKFIVMNCDNCSDGKVRCSESL